MAGDVEYSAAHCPGVGEDEAAHSLEQLAVVLAFVETLFTVCDIGGVAVGVVGEKAAPAAVLEVVQQ